MKCFMIYDETGRIYAAEYGEKHSLQQNLITADEFLEL